MLVQSLVPNQIDILNFADVGWAKMMCPVLFCWSNHAFLVQSVMLFPKLFPISRD